MNFLNNSNFNFNNSKNEYKFLKNDDYSVHLFEKAIKRKDVKKVNEYLKNNNYSYVITELFNENKLFLNDLQFLIDNASYDLYEYSDFIYKLLNDKKY